MKRFLTIRDLADLLQVSIRTTYTLVHEPGFPAVKVRGQIRIPASDLDQWIKAQARVGAERQSELQEAPAAIPTGCDRHSVGTNETPVDR